MGLRGRSCDHVSARTRPNSPVQAPGPEGPHWYAVQTRPRHEKKVLAELQQKAIAAYVPLIAQVRRWSDRNAIVQSPLFPCYAFVNAVLEPRVRLSILQVWGVLSFVGAHNEGLPIPDVQIESLRILLTSTIKFSPCPLLKVGQRVRIRSGALQGIEGILVTNEDHRLVISVEGLQRSLSIDIRGYDIGPA